MSKQIAILLIMALMFFTLCSCSSSSETTSSSNTYTIENNGKTFTVDKDNRTIFDGTHIYKYTFSGDSSSYKITITYPNGSTYFWNYSGTIGTGGWSDNYNENLYVDGFTLCDLVLAKAPKSANSENNFTGMLLICVGIFNAAFPKAAWFIGHGWRYKNAEPSELAIAMPRVAGIIAAVAGIIMWFA